MENTNNPVWKKTWIGNPALNASKNAPTKVVAEVKKPVKEQSKMMMELSKVLEKRLPEGANSESIAVAKPTPVLETKTTKPNLGFMFQELTTAVHRRKSEVSASVVVSESVPVKGTPQSFSHALVHELSTAERSAHTVPSADVVSKSASEPPVPHISFLLRFNQYVIVPVLSEWLPSKDLVHLETSLTNHDEFKQVLGWMQSFPLAFLKCVLGEDLPNKLSLSFFRWIEKLKTDLTPVMRNLVLTDGTMSFIEDLIVKKKSHTQYLDLLKKVRCLTVRTTQDSVYYNYLWGLLDLPNMEEFKLNDINISGSINSHSVWDIAKACKSLRVCHLNSMRVVTDYAVQLICQGCEQLADLNISLCHNVNDASLFAIAVYGRHLKTLNIGHLKFSQRALKLFSIHLQARSHGGLTSLICNEFHDHAFKTFLYFQGSSLTKLNLYLSSHLSDDSLSLIGLTASQLTELDFLNTELSLKGLVEVVQRLPMLRSMSLECNAGHQDNDISAAETQHPLVTLSVHCFYLKELLVRGSVKSTVQPGCFGVSVSLSPPVPSMSASALDLIGSSLSGLHTLYLVDHGLTDDILASIAFHTIGQLVEVDLSHNEKLSDLSVCALIQNSPQLRLLNVSKCELLTDVTLQEVAQCKRLVNLSVSGCIEMRKEGLILVLDQVPTVQRLDLGPQAHSYLPGSLTQRVAAFNAVHQDTRNNCSL